MTGLLAVWLLAQATPKAAPGTEVRALTVTLLDQKGAELGGLALSDVALLENGVSRDITAFAPDRRPLTVAILVDSSASLGADYRLSVVDAVSSLVTRLPDGARYAVWTTGERPTKVLDFTEDRRAAGEALRRVAPQGGNYALDGLVEAASDLKKLAREGDRTAVVAISAAGPEFSYRDRERTVDEAVKKADLFLCAEITSGEADFDQRVALSFAFGRLAEASGGRYETTLSAMGLDAALRKLSPVLHAGYRLAYATAPDLKKRKLELHVTRPGTQVLLPAASVEQR